ncbi:MAG TPA: hypothetical protein VHE30_00615 [Polyangiaceae bacterium]|nr:hypothetical protein [Polyangiaceae bacterium]
MRRSVLLSLLLPALAGCAPDFEPASTLNTLRVLAVQKDKPYAKPGDTVTLRMLYTDASPDAPRPVQVLWLGGFCENPLGDLYAGCFAGLEGGSTGASNAGALGFPPGVVVGQGPTFQISLTKDIISRRPPPPNPKQPRYGISFVFFAVCAGTIEANPNALGPNPSEAFPLACFGAGHERIGPEGFVAGYTEIFAYDQITNENPIVTGFQVDGQDVKPECIGADCIPSEITPPSSDGGVTPDGAAASLDGGSDAAPQTGSGGAGGSGGAPPVQTPDPCKSDSPACIDVCPPGRKDSDCEHTIELVVDPASEEQDGVAVAIEGGNVFEQQWINHYTERGKIPTEVKLLGDATQGFRDSHPTKLVAPHTAGPFHVWAVAHDNRGGANWVRVLMSARE